MSKRKAPRAADEWRFLSRSTQSFCDVHARTWFYARQQAAGILGVSPDDLMCLINARGGPIDVN